MSRREETDGPNLTWLHCRCIHSSNFEVYCSTILLCWTWKRRLWTKSLIWSWTIWSVRVTWILLAETKWGKLCFVDIGICMRRTRVITILPVTCRDFQSFAPWPKSAKVIPQAKVSPTRSTFLRIVQIDYNLILPIPIYVLQFTLYLLLKYHWDLNFVVKLKPFLIWCKKLYNTMLQRWKSDK